MTSTDSGPRVFEPGTESGSRSWRDRIGLRGQDDKIMRNSILLMASSAAMGMFGFAFWLIVARLYDPEQIGTASSLISAVILISYLSLIGLDVTVVRFAGKFADRNAVTTTAMTLIIVVSLVLSVFYVQYAPAYAPELAFVRDDIWFKLAFYAICVLAAVNLFSDSVFLAALRPEFNLYTDGFIQGVFKIAAPFALVGMGAAGIVMATGIGYAMSVIAGFVFMWRCAVHAPGMAAAPVRPAPVLGLLRVGVRRQCPQHRAADAAAHHRAARPGRRAGGLLLHRLPDRQPGQRRLLRGGAGGLLRGVAGTPPTCCR